MKDPIFSGNPFEDIPPEVPDGLYGREQIKKEVETFIENRIHHPERQKPRLAIQGEYGSGKTRTLKYYRHWMNTRSFQGGKRALAVYLDAAGATIDGIYKQLSRSILNEADLGNAKGRMEELIAQLNATLIPDLPEEFSERFTALRQEYNLPESLEVTNADPNQTISAIQKLLAELSTFSYAGVFLLIDEVEEVYKYFSRTMASRVFQSWRQLIEQNIPTLNIILAMTPEAFEVMREYQQEMHYALRERFDVRLTLERVDEAELAKVIAGLLTEVRKPHQFEELLYPFDRRVLPSALRASEGIIRRAMKICHFGFADFLQNKKAITPVNFCDYLASLSSELSFHAEQLNRYQQRTAGKETEIFKMLVSALDGLTASEMKNLLGADISDELANLQEMHKLITKVGEQYKLEDYVALELFPRVGTADTEADLKLIRVDGALAQLRESELLNEVLEGFRAFWNLSTGKVQTRGVPDERTEMVQNKVLLEVDTTQHGKRKVALTPIFKSIPQEGLEEIHHQLKVGTFDFVIFLVLADSEELRTQIQRGIEELCASRQIEGYFLNDAGELEASCPLSRFVKAFSLDTNHPLLFEGEKKIKSIGWLKLLRVIPYFAINYPPYAEEISFQYIDPHLVDTCFAFPNVRFRCRIS